jgi:transposase, IS5 family
VMCAEKIRRLLRLFFVAIFVWLCAWQWRGCLWIERRNTWQFEMADLLAAV